MNFWFIVLLAYVLASNSSCRYEILFQWLLPHKISGKMDHYHEVEFRAFHIGAA